ncbi:DUF881 domain-containing protein [Anaerotignum sp.]
MTRHHYSIALTATCILLGVIVGVQYNTVKQQRLSTENQRLSEVTLALNQAQEERDALQKQKEALEKTLEEYEEGTYSGVEIEQLRQFAGLTSITGEGVIVTMNDSSTNMGGDRNAYLVHAEDLLSVVNELNGAGAKAVSINEQRMVGKSAITCAGSIVMVNGVRVAAPFEIKAVGDPDVLQSALKFPGGVVDSLTPWGIEITIRKEATVTVPAYTQTTIGEEDLKEEEE